VRLMPRRIFFSSPVVHGWVARLQSSFNPVHRAYLPAFAKAARTSRVNRAINFLTRPHLAVNDWAREKMLLVALCALALPLWLLPTQHAQESIAERPPINPEAVADDATLNLHRWGAVTLFHGLPSDRVRAITEDASGAIWIGTDNGLIRYDGRNTQAFAQESALPSRRILSLAVDARGALWIGTESGAARWRNEQLQVLEETRGRAINGLAASPQGEVVAVTSQGELLRYQLNAVTAPNSQVAEPGKLPVGKLDAANHRLLSLAEQNGAAQPLNLTSVAVAPNGAYFIGSGGRGAMIHQSLSGQPAEQLREIALQPPRPYHLNAIFAAGKQVWLGEQSGRTPGLWLFENDALTRLPFATGTVTAIHGNDGDVWAGTFAQGAFLLRNGQVVEHLTFENTAGGLRSNRINAIYRDREGIVWFGTDRGVCRYDRESFRTATLSARSQSNFVRVLLQASNGETWCGTNRGLFRLNAGADLGPWSAVAEIEDRAVYALLEHDGVLWAGTSNGLFRKAADTPTFERVSLETILVVEPVPGDEPATSENPQSAIRNPQSRESVRALAFWRGALYAAVYERGLARLAADATVTWLAGDRSLNYTLCLTPEGEQALWIGSSVDKLWRYDGAQVAQIDLRTIHQFNDPYREANIATDTALRALVVTDQRVWLGTSNGLYVREGDTIRQILPREKADVFALQITRTDDGREVVWCGTRNAGLIKYLPDENVSIRFDTEQGLASSQVFAIATRPDANHLWIGTNRGVVRHQPSNAPPHLEIRRLVANQIYLPEYLTAELALPSTSRNFLLEVTALGSRTFPSQFQYEFTIERRDGTERKTTLTPDAQFAVNNLRSGPYTITARALSRDLVYSAPVVLRLRVQRPPFPWSTVLLAIGLLLTLGVAFLIFRQRQRLALTNTSLEKTNAELQEMRIRLANETEAERARIARDLHDQTLGDLRHLLVLTDQLPKADSGALENHPHAPTPTLLRREIESISNEIRHICEDLSPSVLANIGFLPALEWALTDAVAHLPAQEKFAYEFHCEPELEERLRLSATEEIQLYRIVQEALNNVCRHARAKQVRLSVRGEQTDLVIEVQDDGHGFAGVSSTATGHGIANIRSRANLLNARVVWQDAQPGCRFVVRLAHAVQPSAAGKDGWNKPAVE
jgi:ligand-binding sensor domain-containing protein/signal transduction histidine kinase